jgi:hypothetical protein
VTDQQPLLVLPRRPGTYVLKTRAGSSFVLDLIKDTVITATCDGTRSEPAALRTITNAIVGEQAYITADDPRRRSGAVWHLTAEITRIEELPA